MESVDTVVAGAAGARRGKRPGPHLPAALTVFVLAALVVAAALTACGGPTEGGASGEGAGATPRQGGTFNYPLSADAHPFDPGLNQYEGGNAVLHQIYEGLVKWELQPDGTLRTVPCLAEGWTPNADCSVWTFALRRGVTFQAPVSREFTARDVVRDLRYLADPASAEVMDQFVPQEEIEAGTTMGYYLTDIEGTDENGVASPAALGVEALGRYTVRITLKRPFSEFPDTLGGQAFWIWPEDYRQKVGPKAYAEHPVGTGPYMFQQRAYGKSIDLTRNPDWWDTSGGPYIDRIHYQVYASADAMVRAFREGLMDWTPVAPDQVEASRALPQVESGRWTAESEPGLATWSLEVNMKDPVVGGEEGLPLRQALTCGCDRQVAIDIALGGSGVELTGLVPPGVPGSQLVRGPYTYDAGRATDLYAQAGSPPLMLVYPATFMREVAASIPPAYGESGISIATRGMTQEPFWAAYLGGKTQLCPMGWGADYPSMDNFLYPMFHSGSPSNSTSYSNKEVDALLDQARATVDAEARLQLYAAAERLILADAPVVPLYVPTDNRLLNNRVANVNFDSLGWVDLWKAWVR